MYRLSDGLPSDRDNGSRRSDQCNRKYLQTRRRICKKRSDQSDQNRNFYGKSIRRGCGYGIGEDIPKGKIFECVKALKSVEVPAPVHIGDVLVKDVAGTGVDIVATKNVESI